jgi:6-phosphogluconolactonase
MQSLSNATLVYVGTSGPKSKGIYYYRLQTDNLEVSQNITLVPLGLAAETPNPNFIEVDLKRRLLFAATRVDQFGGKPGGAISSFAVDAATGKLNLINQSSCMGRGPCHLALDATGRNVVVSMCDSGGVAVIPVAPDGKLGEATDFAQHTGKSVNPDRQKGPHAHCVTFDPANQFVFVCDLGLDKIMTYRFDAQRGKITPGDPPFTAAKPGAGPRHMAFLPGGRFAYAVNELDSTVTSYAYDGKAGILKPIETQTTLPGYYDGPANTPAEVAAHPSGRWIYVSNRGMNSIILFGVDPDKGTLTYIEEQGTGGKTPRHFGIQPSAKHMVICNQDSDTLLASRIDSGNGRLKPSGLFAQAPTPMCAKFLPPASEVSG